MKYVYVITEFPIVGHSIIIRVMTTHMKAKSYIRKHKVPYAVYEITKMEVCDEI